MAKIIGFIMCVCAMSLFFFPVTFAGMPPSTNSKMVMAAIGLFLFIYDLAKTKESHIDKRLITIIVFALLVSLSTYVSIVINNTLDYTYVTYINSMLVWTIAAYLVLQVIEGVHGYVDVKLIIIYLMAMCTLQCILAISIDMNADVQKFVDRFYPDSAFFHEKKRMYGFGCGLDVAGGRFSAVLVMIAYLLYGNSRKDNWQFSVFCITCFVIISAIGNMMGRTTTVGMVLGLLIILYSLFAKGTNHNYIGSIVSILSVMVVVSVILYNTNAGWHDNFKFGFEGFFSLVEKGKWEVHSNEMLQEGFIFPDNLKTWLIGDGYFDEPSHTTSYYTGPSFYGYYMGTDAGYSRFLFYFGLFGLLAFSGFFISVANFCAKYFPRYEYMFGTILILNFIIWIKVSTDIYVTFAPFVCLSMMKAFKIESPVLMVNKEKEDGL